MFGLWGKGGECLDVFGEDGVVQVPRGGGLAEAMVGNWLVEGKRGGRLVETYFAGEGCPGWCEAEAAGLGPMGEEKPRLRVEDLPGAEKKALETVGSVGLGLETGGG
ncbi:hypothetical protein MRB53_009005 [Persea americana]|uniref:Uncharacterized protein n=1 Tax=Persea americana TaxID=3435 RepID=A0ACC2LNK2_PERAE|nr:hypothetical protein MRB53_009005 [Persea americana]